MSASTSRDEEPRDPLLARTRRLHASDAAVARAWQRLQRRDAATAPRRGKDWRAWFAVVSAATAVVIVAIAFVRWSGVPTTIANAPVATPTPTPTPMPMPTPAALPSGLAQAQLFALHTSDVQANLLGPGKVEVSAGTVTLLEGALFGTATNAVVIRARDVEVRVPAKAVFEVRILSTGVTVAAWQGELAVVRGEGHVEAIRDGMRSEGALSATTTTTKVVRSPPAPAPTPMRASTPAPSPVPPPAAAARPLALDEGELLQRAVHELRRQKDPRRAIAALAEYERAYPEGSLRREARLLRIDSLLALDDKPAALAELDALGDDLPRVELRLVRGELRAYGKRYRDALTDLQAVDRPPLATDRDKGARLVWALAVCHAALGDHDAKRQALERYLADFPDGPRASAARDGLR